MTPPRLPRHHDVVRGGVRATLAAAAADGLLERRGRRLVHVEGELARRRDDLDFGGFRGRRLVGLLVAEVGAGARRRQRERRALRGFGRQLGGGVRRAHVVEARAPLAPSRRRALVARGALVEGGGSAPLRRPRGAFRR